VKGKGKAGEGEEWKRGVPLNRHTGSGEAIAPLLIMIKGQDMYFAPLLKFKKRIYFLFK